METQDTVNQNTVDFAFEPTAENRAIIKVIGVGGGGSNAVDSMYKANIEDVSYLIINTDWQALKGSPIPNKLLISEKGLGAGAKPEVAHDFAVSSADQIRQCLNDGTEMVFITAGMGGGTGTGAAPVVAEIAQQMGILTVGIVTIPFRFEGQRKIMKALEGVRAIEKHCDALLVINNNRLIEVYHDLTFDNAFKCADDTLTTAAKSISDIINKKGYINLDFADVSTTLRNGGVALISTGLAHGENRLTNAIKAATTSPLLQDNNYTDAKHLLFELCFSQSNPLTMAEMDEMNKFVEGLNPEIEVIWGAMHDDELGDDVRIILLASGFSMDHTGKVIAGDRMEAKIREMQTKLRNAIIESRDHLAEFDGFPEAANILLEAQRLATDKADHLSIEDSVEDESMKLQIALAQAQDKKDEIITEQAKAQAEAAAAARREEIEQQIAALQQLKNSLELTPEPETPAVTVNPEPGTATTAPETKTTAPAAQQPVVKEPSLFADTEEPTPSPAVAEPQTKPATDEPQTTPVTAAPPAKPVSAPTPRPTSNALSGIEEVRRYYGEEEANRMILGNTRKAYYMLDDKDLTNEELIELLRKLPAYNRSLEDLNQLKAVSRQPAQPKVIERQEKPDGTIKF